MDFKCVIKLLTYDIIILLQFLLGLFKLPLLGQIGLLFMIPPLCYGKRLFHPSSRKSNEEFGAAIEEDLAKEFWLIDAIYGLLHLLF